MRLLGLSREHSTVALENTILCIGRFRDAFSFLSLSNQTRLQKSSPTARRYYVTTLSLVEWRQSHLGLKANAPFLLARKSRPIRGDSGRTNTQTHYHMAEKASPTCDTHWGSSPFQALRKRIPGDEWRMEKPRGDGSGLVGVQNENPCGWMENPPTAVSPGVDFD